MKHYFYLIIFFILSMAHASASELGQQIKLQSKILNAERTIRVSLPANYQTEGFYQFPVLYLTDAESQFDHLASTIHYLSGTISPMIVVGISQQQRFSELAPFTSEKTESAASAQFFDFITNEVKPYINKHYRTADFDILLGHSLGGVFTLNAYYQKPYSFSAFIALAPSLAWGNEVLLDYLPKSFANKEQPFLAIHLEGESTFATPKKSFDALSKLINAQSHLRATHTIELLDGEDHMSVAHLGSYKTLKGLFSNWFLSLPKLSEKENALTQHYQDLSDKLGYSVKPTEYDLWALTSALISQKNLPMALSVAQQAKAYYPKSHFSYSLLADVAQAQQNNTLAKRHLTTAIQFAKSDIERQQKYQARMDKL